MKNIILVICMILLVSQYYGFNSTIYGNNTDPYVNDENIMVNISYKHVKEMLGGDFNTVTNNFSTDTISAIFDTYNMETDEFLETVWNILTANIGDFIEIISIQKVIIPNFGLFDTPSTIVGLEYELGILVLVFQFNKDNEVIGLSMEVRPYPIPYELANNDYFEETSIFVGGEEYPLNGILTMPHNIDSPPVVILIQGSGQTDMNGTYAFLTVFSDIAHGLAENGIASIRYNKRYYQYPPQPFDMTISQEVLYDVNYAIEWAKKHDNISDIYVAGLSLGGMLSPKIALDNKDVSGIISLAGSPRRLEDIAFDQVKKQLFSIHISDEEKEQIIESLKEDVDLIKNLDKNYLDEEELLNIVLGYSKAYWISLNEIDAQEILSQLDIPMLILQGEEDLQVFADIDFLKWKDLLDNRDNVTFILYDGLNHFFTPHNELLGFAQFMEPANVCKQVITDISYWINNLS